MTAPLRNILIVDDEPNNRDLFARYIKRAGHTAQIAEDGFQALEHIGDSPPDLVLLDWMMPELSGMDVLRSLRERYSSHELPIIMCTALDDADYVVAALSEGANDFVSKPVNPVILKARITAQLERKDGMAALGHMNERLGTLVAERTRALAHYSETSQQPCIISSEAELPALKDLLETVIRCEASDIAAHKTVASHLLNRLEALMTPQTGESGIAC